ncbi:MAG: prepilin-type N-terminal cleavage/methylation domain-containing protein [Verrucomicrobiaceae bacterium]|nr:MAG: prepilin-type N-terminal cleavage/methylation domain-containing protein [Verrucomicrobiaceae bacterium]
MLNSSNPVMRKTSAFTLIELLIVIAIIGILMSLLFPAVNSAIDAARKAQAKNDVTQIATAIVAYETEYGKLPLPTKTTVDTALVNILAGIDTSAANNPRGIVFLEVGARKPDIPGKGGKSGTNASGFVDPWGSVYQIVMDTDYNNRIDVTAGKESAAGSDTITDMMKKVAVFNFSSSSSDTKATNFYRRAVRSW